ncbi:MULTISPECIES: hypothetical protein [unclassified Aureimonas]|uniref:hypothetical protein n=1 Tax=unclassified Aureimonas TaxID=2615206 RepID=UPI000700A842|nr:MULTISPECIES: hypothetical protein [unclassified Aureimonas]KQT64414.1 hypothetical protein ASG62_05460 [Aureimonas sp. Leaf427]KQT81604.1 hypothetical protein ASG54_02740 [Aureimonas sp. Leaf460]
MTSDFEKRPEGWTGTTGSPEGDMRSATAGNTQSGYGRPAASGDRLPTVDTAFGQRGYSGQDTSGGAGQTGSAGAEKDRFANAVDRETGSARAELSSATESVKQGVSSLGETAREKAAEGVEKGKAQLTSSIGDFAAAVRKASDELGERDQSMAAGLVREVANGLEQATGAIEGRSLQDLSRSVASFARRQPTTFLIGAALAGIALGRFARASGEHEQGSPARGRSEWDDGRRYGRSGSGRDGPNRTDDDLYRNDGGAVRGSEGRSYAGGSAASTPVSPPVSAGTAAPRSTFSGASTHAGSASPAATSPDKAPAEGPSGAVLGHGSGSFNPEGGRDVR